jgi:uncharacterized integral membrane protein
MFLIVVLAVYLLLGVFVVQNGGSQDFTFLGYTRHLPTWAPTAAAAGVTSALMLLHMGTAGMGDRFRRYGHNRDLDQHRGLIAELRDENARLREELAAAGGAARRAAANRRSVLDSLRGRFQGRHTT